MQKSPTHCNYAASRQEARRRPAQVGLQTATIQLPSRLFFTNRLLATTASQCQCATAVASLHGRWLAGWRGATTHWVQGVAHTPNACRPRYSCYHCDCSCWCMLCASSLPAKLPCARWSRALLSGWSCSPAWPHLQPGLNSCLLLSRYLCTQNWRQQQQQ